MIIKVCGMRNADNIQQVSQIEGIDWMGFIFTDKSKRYVHTVDGFNTNTNKKKVGVFVDAEIDEIIEKIEKYNIDILQLHGSESPEYIDRLKSTIENKKSKIAGSGSPRGLGAANGIKFMKAFAVDSYFDFETTKPFEGIVDYFLFDAKGKEAGGNGIQFDWSVMDRYDGETTFLLAGGINPASVDKIKSFNHPKWIGIDVNSGFEVEPGMKNERDLIQFSKSINELSNPVSVVRQFVKRFNKADAIALSELYHEDAMNHQVTQDPIVGKENIKKMFETEFAQAEMTCIPENILKSGDWAILEWKDPFGLRGCGFFKIEKGKIIFQRGYWDKLSFLKMHGLPIE